MSILFESPTQANHVNPVHKPGTVVWYNHPTYGAWKLIYVQMKDAVTYVAGHVLQWAATDKTAMTNDISGGSAITGGRASGIGLRVYTADYYGYALQQGYYPTIKTNGDDDIAAGDSLIPGAADGVCDSVAAATTTVHTKTFGFATVADVDADNTVAGIVNIV